MKIVHIKLLLIESIHATHTFYHSANCSIVNIPVFDRSKRKSQPVEKPVTIFVAVAPKFIFEKSSLSIQNGYLDHTDNGYITLTVNWETDKVNSCRLISTNQSKANQISQHQIEDNTDQYLSFKRLSKFELDSNIAETIYTYIKTPGKYQLFDVYVKNYTHLDNRMTRTNINCNVITISSKPTNYFVHKQYKYNHKKLELAPWSFHCQTIEANLSEKLSTLIKPNPKLSIEDSIKRKKEFISKINIDNVSDVFDITENNINTISFKIAILLPFLVVNKVGDYLVPVVQMGPEKYLIQLFLYSEEEDISTIKVKLVMINYTKSYSPVFEKTAQITTNNYIDMLYLSDCLTIQLGAPITICQPESIPTYMIWVVVLSKLTVCVLDNTLFLITAPLSTFSKQPLDPTKPSSNDSKAPIKYLNKLNNVILAATIGIYQGAVQNGRLYPQVKLFGLAEVMSEHLIATLNIKISELIKNNTINVEIEDKNTTIILSPCYHFEESFELTNLALFPIWVKYTAPYNKLANDKSYMVKVIPIGFSITCNVTIASLAYSCQWLLGRCSALKYVAPSNCMRLHECSYSDKTNLLLPFFLVSGFDVVELHREWRNESVKVEKSKYKYLFNLFSRTNYPFSLSMPNTARSDNKGPTLTQQTVDRVEQTNSNKHLTSLMTREKQLIPILSTIIEDKMSKKSHSKEKHIIEPISYVSIKSNVKPHNVLLVMGHPIIRVVTKYVSILTHQPDSIIHTCRSNISIDSLYTLMSIVSENKMPKIKRVFVSHQIPGNGLEIFAPIIYDETCIGKNLLKSIIVTRSSICFIYYNGRITTSGESETYLRDQRILDLVVRIKTQFINYNYIICSFEPGMTAYYRNEKHVEYMLFNSDETINNIILDLVDKKTTHPTCGAITLTSYMHLWLIRQFLQSETVPQEIKEELAEYF